MWHFDGNIDALKTSDEVWDDETGETVAQAFARFSRGLDMIPDDIANELVPSLMKAGIEVWSFGYGDDPGSFTTLTPEEPDEDEYTDWSEGTNTQIWGPFGIWWETVSHESLIRFGADYLLDLSMSPFMPDILDGLLVAASQAIKQEARLIPAGTSILGIASVKE